MKTHYIAGERINLVDSVVLTGNHLDEEHINEKYIRGEVRIITEQARYPLSQIPMMVNDPSYHLNPEFQRRHRWSDSKKSKLIESFIINVPIPPIFLYEVDYSEFEVMDGLQRLTAISQFYNDDFALEGLKEWPELNGLRYSELPRQVKRGIDRRYISSIILLQETAKSEQEAERLKQMVFERLNSGGEELKAQEIRNALYPGRLNNLTIKLARNPHYCTMWQIPTPTKDEILDPSNIPASLIRNPRFSSMSDVEGVLRFFAYRQIEQFTSTTLESFLDEYLKKGNQEFGKDTLDGLEVMFSKTCELIHQLFGDKAFCLYRTRNEKPIHYDRPTKLLYDPLMFVCSNLLMHSDKLINRKSEIIKDIPNLHLNNLELFEGRRTNKVYVIKRVELFTEFFEKYL
ncbi:DUF262 domain-containing protein [Vibrio cyclitrophicus]|uniref:DUF262 domain-containing protein n=2 Tax=Vibrio TaxID=662 RepID=UPI000C83659C|nr:DUF262 domain-containing protein [Vibrio cyclitrophicus]MCC4773688.1 DUF262 domain-containing protein [Vibrio cyclitrophicus]MCC4842010.1 DUF262 domain-containing protein [Vibrio cyclitrophicus]PME13532.1 hypothetical protein BCV42_17195 [Vibrio cyclitrophicus]PME53970.1 hypothetical protein BCV37_09020 [Vibrio cyclitrophicus]PME82977.1 hypothetical protein BCV28_13610 [Vibrio cyclitrophicus]